MSLHETTRSLSLNIIKHSNDNVSFLPVYYSCWRFTMARSSSAADTPSLFPSPRLRPPPLQLRRKGNKPVWSSPSHLFTSTIIKSFLLLLSESVHSFPQIAAQSRLFVTYCRSDVRCDASSAVKFLPGCEGNAVGGTSVHWTLSSIPSLSNRFSSRLFSSRSSSASSSSWGNVTRQTQV